VETEDVVHVLRNVHGSLAGGGHLLDAHPLGLDFAVRAGSRGLGFVDASAFARIVAAMDSIVEQTIAEGLFEDVTTVRRHVAERFDDASEALEQADGWENLRMPPAVRRKLRETDQRPIEFLDSIAYRLLKKSAERV
jgi:hypothetical protein